MSYVICHMSHVICCMSHAICHMSHVICDMSHVICHISHVVCHSHISHVICHMSYVTFHMRSCKICCYIYDLSRYKNLLLFTPFTPVQFYIELPDYILFSTKICLLLTSSVRKSTSFYRIEKAVEMCGFISV